MRVVTSEGEEQAGAELYSGAKIGARLGITRQAA
jgi:biotin operon repressor